MYGALPAGGHSPKPLNSPNGAQLKSSTDNIQNSSVKSKKREHGAHSSDSVKRSKAEDADSAQLRPEDMLKIEISKITDKGGLVNFEGVEKIIKLMQPENSEKKVDLASRIMLVDVISVTESFEFLSRFVQLRGLLILDEWLQEVHKGKIGDCSPKGSDKSVEEFLFALLRALDRLPVNLHALQTCNVGKSVNHLRSHKNPEILKKARSLVDTWKKRVEAEMNIIETRSGTRRGGSWPNKSMMSEVSHMGNRRISGSSEAGPKISPTQSSVLKPQQGKHGSGESILKSPESPSPTKVQTPVAADVPPVTAKEEKSSSSSPSGNNSLSCSSEHGKAVTSCKEDAPSSTSGSINKNIGSISQSRKSSTVKTTPERVADTSFADNTNSPRLIVRLPSTGLSPARTASGKVDAPPRNSVVAMSTDPCQEKEKGSVIKPCDGEAAERLTEASKATESASGGTMKSYEACYSSINALVESCAKFSELNNASVPAGDDVGMNLLASVAAGEISGSDAGSPENKRLLPEERCSENDAKSRQSSKDGYQNEDNLKVPNGHVMMEQASGSQQQQVNDISADNKVKTDTGNGAKVETQINDESASCSSSEKHLDDKKLVVKEDSKGSELPTTSCSHVGLVPKAEEAVDKKIGSQAEQIVKAVIDPHSSVLLQTSKDKKEVSVHENRSCLKQSDVGDVSDQHASISTPVSEMSVKLDFDLNEVLPNDDGAQGDVERSSFPTPFSLPSRPASVTVAAAAKGPFISSEGLLRGKSELGWKGSAATSAFRPAEPRKPVDVQVSDNKQSRGFLDFDLNVGAVEDIGQNNAPSRYLGRPSGGGGGLDLDLNTSEDGGPDVGHLSVSMNRPVVQQLPSRSLLSEEVGGDSIPFSRNGMQFLPAVPSVRMNNMEMGNLSWFPSNTTYPTMAVRGDQGYGMIPGAQRMLTPASEVFRGPVLSSSPAVAFSSNAPFQFPGFPFETNFSNTTAYVGPPGSGGPVCFPSQLVGASGTGYRPYVMSLGGGSSNAGKWGSPGGGGGGLDLNSGPGGGAERDEILRPVAVGGDEQLKIFQQLKRKDPLDGWDGDRINNYKHHQPSWQ